VLRHYNEEGIGLEGDASIASSRGAAVLHPYKGRARERQTGRMTADPSFRSPTMVHRTTGVDREKSQILTKSTTLSAVVQQSHRAEYAKK